MRHTTLRLRAPAGGDDGHVDDGQIDRAFGDYMGMVRTFSA